MGVFKRQPATHMHVRTPVMIGLIVLLVLLGSAFCYYRVGASQSGIRDQAPGPQAAKTRFL